MRALPAFFTLLLALTVAAPASAGVGSSGPRAAGSEAEVLRVCTTGDYPPLTSYDPATGAFTGLAPTVLENFGRSHNYSVEFVRTTWEDLEVALANASNCLLAAGGIIDRPARVANFGVSVPILENRKVPVFSKENEGMFLKFSDFDRASVTLLENLGTDEVFAETLRSQGLLQKPSVKTVASSEEAYACIVQYPKLPLVMFADVIEVDFWAARDAALSTAGEAIELPDKVGSQGYQVYLANNSTAGMTALFELNRFLTGARAMGLFDAWEHAARDAVYEVPHAACPLQFSLV